MSHPGAGNKEEEEPLLPLRDRGREKSLECRGSCVILPQELWPLAQGYNQPPRGGSQARESSGFSLDRLPWPLSGGSCWELDIQEAPLILSSLQEHRAGCRRVESGPGGMNGNDPAQILYSWKFLHPPLRKNNPFYRERLISLQNTGFNSLQ